MRVVPGIAMCKALTERQNPPPILAGEPSVAPGHQIEEAASRDRRRNWNPLGVAAIYASVQTETALAEADYASLVPGDSA